MNSFLKIKNIIEATGGEVINEPRSLFTGVSIDSRTINKGELFVALKGDNLDGHDFVKDALTKGSGAMISRGWFEKNAHLLDKKTYVIVEDPLNALQRLAAKIRDRFNGHVFAVAGSNGKTTTKELISSILATKWDVLKTVGNYNNHIGLPLCICRADAGKDVMLLEMGTNRPGDIDFLCRIARPDTAVITNIGYEHIEGFGSIENVRKSELEILPYIKELVVNADDLFLMDGVYGRYDGKITTFGIQTTSADVTAGNIDFQEDYSGFYLNASGSSIFIKSRLSGLFNVYNCLAAAAVALSAGLDLQRIKEGIETCKGVKLRFEIKRHKGITFLNDVYNANPSSMEASIGEMMRFFSSSRNADGKYKRVIVILGDMLELGDYSRTAHEKLGMLLSELPVDIFIGVGKEMVHALSRFKKEGIHAENSAVAGEKITGMLRERDLVLVKGSRGMKMENIFTIVERLV